jgi:hypothetical protein
MHPQTKIHICIQDLCFEKSYETDKAVYMTIIHGWEIDLRFFMLQLQLILLIIKVSCLHDSSIILMLQMSFAIIFEYRFLSKKLVFL